MYAFTPVYYGALCLMLAACVRTELELISPWAVIMHAVHVFAPNALHTCIICICMQWWCMQYQPIADSCKQIFSKALLPVSMHDYAAVSVHMYSVYMYTMHGVIIYVTL